MSDPARDLPEAGERTPWGFRIVVGLAIAYVALRLVQMAGWVVDWVR